MGRLLKSVCNCNSYEYGSFGGTNPVSLVIYLYKFNQYNLFSLNFNSLICKTRLIAVPTSWDNPFIELVRIKYSIIISDYYSLSSDLVEDLNVRQKCVWAMEWSLFTSLLFIQQDLVLVRYCGTRLRRVSINLIEIVRPFPSCNVVFLFWTHLNHKVKDAVILLGPPK